MEGRTYRHQTHINHTLRHTDSRHADIQTHRLTQTLEPMLQDPRLNFVNYTDDITEIKGQDWITGAIWTPNIFIENERESSLLQNTRDSSFVRITKSGEVVFHYRVKTLLMCDMNLARFPHDTQNCTMGLESCES